MKLYLLKIENRNFVGYDAYDSCLVRAETEEQARNIAAAELLGWQSKFWTDPAIASCQEVTQNGEPEIIIDSYNAG
jgi:hypothetical protein